jgi:hypothetical protein
VTVNFAVVVLPLRSVAEQVPRILPTLKRLPDGGLHASNIRGSASTALRFRRGRDGDERSAGGGDEKPHRCPADS